MTVKKRLSTGVVPAPLYARKIKRTIFAQLRNEIKRGEVSSNEVAFRVGQLNRFLYDILAKQEGIDKRDMIRIRVDYEISNGELKWDYNSVEVEIWRYDSELSKKVRETISTLLEEIDFLRGLTLNVEQTGRTIVGEDIYIIKQNGEIIGAIKTTRINSEMTVVGAIKSPPRKIRAVMPGDTDVAEMITSILARSEAIQPTDAERIIENIIRESTGPSPGS